jgi:hypothetical protein
VPPLAEADQRERDGQRRGDVTAQSYSFLDVGDVDCTSASENGTIFDAIAILIATTEAHTKGSGKRRLYDTRVR